jgi:SAM-dependent methyltransferase
MSNDHSAPAAAKEYDRAYFVGQTTGSFTSAKRIVPIVMEMLNPTSVIDVGCGVGAWARCFRDHGVSRVLGIDGDYVDRAMLLIDQDCFLSRDLTQPLDVTERFDVAVSLEVACDLPPECAGRFVQDLAGLAPVVLFSAAIPYQGGLSHVNEQWQSYWADLFDQHAYVAIDAIRPAVWSDERVMWWYAQNAFLYVHRDALDERFSAARIERSPAYLDVVAPRFYLYQRGMRGRPGVRVSAGLLGAAVARKAIGSCRRALRRLWRRRTETV